MQSIATGTGIPDLTPEELVGMLDEERKAFGDPSVFLNGIIERGSVLADMGAGAGYYEEYLKNVCSKIYCVEINKQFLSIMRERFSEQKNIVILDETAWATSIPSGSVDYVLFANSFPYMEKKKETVEEAARILVPNGKVIIVDWKVEKDYLGPSRQYRMQKKEFVKAFKPFKFEREFYVGPYHIGLLFSKKQ